MKKKKMITQRKPMLTALSLSMFCLQSFAIPYAPGVIYHPIHYGPNTNTLAPSSLTPQEVRTAYGFTPIFHQGFRGQGQTIAIIDAFDDPNIEADLAVFNKQFGLLPCTTQNGCFKKIFANTIRPPANAGWAGEIALDVEWAHAMAPYAKIYLIEAASDNPQDLYQAIEVGIQNGANIVSMSWGAPEYPGQIDNDAVFKKYPTVTFVASSGDSGAGTMHPAASPYVLSVGGTTLSVDSLGNYNGETAWSGSSGGVSTVEPTPAFQVSLPIPMSNDMRGVPDVAYNADPNTGFSVYNSVPGEGGTGWQVVGGTSAGAPQWAALVAVLNSATHTNVGSNLNTLLYAAANVSTGKYHYLFSDIISGSNGTCDYYCMAQQGYDYVTGLGSPEVNALITDFMTHPSA